MSSPMTRAMATVVSGFCCLPQKLFDFMVACDLHCRSDILKLPLRLQQYLDPPAVERPDAALR
jgi:hypothetical protein